MGAVVDCYPPHGGGGRGGEVAVLSLNSLPLGFRFRPSDEELVDYYLRQKINGNGEEVWVIREIDVCKWEPWDLPDLSVIRNKDPEWFFFCPQDRKYPNGHRLNRATNHGYWKATGKDRRIKSGANLIGMKKTLVFYTGRAPKGKRTNWVMHEYRPTLKELDGTNPGQNAYVLCRLFKKQDESLEALNCDEVEQTDSAPMAANYSPEDVQSDQALVVVSPSQVTEDDNKHQAINPENSEEIISSVKTPAECQSDGCDACHALNSTLLYMDFSISNDPIDKIINDKVFSPPHYHMPPEFYYQASNEPDGRYGFHYGTNETMIPDIIDFVNSDGVTFEDPYNQMQNTVFNVPQSVSGSDSEVDVVNMIGMHPINIVYPDEAIDVPLATTPEFCSTITSGFSGDEQKSNIGFFQSNIQMASSSVVNMGQGYGVCNDYEQSRNLNMAASGDTGIQTRTRQVRNEQPGMNLPSQGTAQRRIRLSKHGLGSKGIAKDGSGAQEHNSKPIIAGENKASENHDSNENATANNALNDPEEKSESADDRKISKQGVHAGSILGFKEFLLRRRVSYISSKASYNRKMWSSVVVVSAFVLVLFVFIANIWGYLKF